jgi:TorA maturation chaperone TorD
MSAPSKPGSAVALAPEEALRAEIYGVLAHLFACGPDAGLLRSIAQSPVTLGAATDPLGTSWSALKLAAAGAHPNAVAIEHAGLFVGIGRAPVSIYASHYLSDTWKEHTLVDLRDQLRLLGLGRQSGVSQPEDHLASLLDVMRHLALRGDDAAALGHQRQFFVRYLGPWHAQFCEQVSRQSGAVFYRVAASMLMAFCILEQQAFGLDY